MQCNKCGSNKLTESKEKNKLIQVCNRCGNKQVVSLQEHKLVHG